MSLAPLWNQEKQNKLSRDKELELILKAKSGDDICRENLILGSLHIVESIAKKFYSWKNGLDWSDLIQIGSMGLLDAIDKFNPEFNVPFNFYAKQWINARISSTIYQTGRTIRTPVVKARLISKITKLTNEFIEMHQRSPSYDELSELSGIDVKKIKKIVLSKVTTFSIQTPILNDSGNMSIEDLIESKEMSIVNSIEKQEIIDIILEKISELSSMDRYIIENYFGLNNNTNMTLEELGKKFNMTKQGIRLRKNRILRNMYNHLRRIS